MKPAMLVIDMQKDFFERKISELEKERLINKAGELLDFFRRKEMPLFHIITQFKEDKSDVMRHMKEKNAHFCIENTAGCQELSEIRALEDEIVIIKNRYSGFYNTDLDRQLRDLGVTTLVIAGIFTHACIQITAIDAYQRDYEVIIAEECIRSYNKAYHKVAKAYLKKGLSQFMSNDEIISYLAKSGPSL